MGAEKEFALRPVEVEMPRGDVDRWLDTGV